MKTKSNSKMPDCELKGHEIPWLSRRDFLSAFAQVGVALPAMSLLGNELVQQDKAPEQSGPSIDLIGTTSPDGNWWLINGRPTFIAHGNKPINTSDIY